MQNKKSNNNNNNKYSILIVIRIMYRFLGIPDSDKPNRKKSF